MSAIQADYRTHKHIPSRKCYQLIMEVSEESFPEVCRVLGYPATGENTYVGIALLSNGSDHKPPVVVQSNIQQTEGEKLRIRAVMLCKEDSDFRFFSSKGSMLSLTRSEWEEYCRTCICNYCNITSRSELVTNLAAQAKFKELLDKYKDWQFEQRHADNINKI